MKPPSRLAARLGRWGLAALACGLSLAAMGAPARAEDAALAQQTRALLGVAMQEPNLDVRMRMLQELRKGVAPDNITGAAEIDQAMAVTLALRNQQTAAAATPAPQPVVAQPVAQPTTTGWQQVPLASTSTCCDADPVVVQEPVVVQQPVVVQEPVVVQQPVVVRQPVVTSTPTVVVRETVPAPIYYESRPSVVPGIVGGIVGGLIGSIPGWVNWGRGPWRGPGPGPHHGPRPGPRH